MNTAKLKQLAGAITKGEWRRDVWEYPQANPPRKEMNVQTDSILLATFQCDFDENNPYIVPKAEAKANAEATALVPQLISEVLALRAEMLVMVGQCRSCNGTGTVTRSLPVGSTLAPIIECPRCAKALSLLNSYPDKLA